MSKMSVIATTIHPAENQLIKAALKHYGEALAMHASQEAAAGRDATNIIPSVLAARILCEHDFATVKKQRL